MRAGGGGVGGGFGLGAFKLPNLVAIPIMPDITVSSKSPNVLSGFKSIIKSAIFLNVLKILSPISIIFSNNGFNVSSKIIFKFYCKLFNFFNYIFTKGYYFIKIFIIIPSNVNPAKRIAVSKISSDLPITFF